jgi:16S rRNA G966 N2-methylase RsmD
VRLIEENLTRVLPDDERPREAARERYAIIRAEFVDAVARVRGPFDLVVLDPPYTERAAAEALDAAAPLVGPSTRLVIEHAKRHAAPAERAGLRLARTILSGDSALAFYVAA